MTGQDLGVALITGAASGMGQATARLMAEQGWSLLLCDRAPDRLSEVADHLRAWADPEVVPGDIAGQGFPDQLACALDGRPVAALVHCAGLSSSMAGPEQILDVNLAATMRLVEIVRPRICDGAAAVLFASTAAHLLGSVLDEAIASVVAPGQVGSLIEYAPSAEAAYSISKRGVQLLVRREASAFGARGARIVSLSPGIIDTPMARAEMQQHPMMKEMIASSPIARAAHPDEVARVAMFLCSRAASFITGTDILVDGGSVAATLAGASANP
ncbi:MAG TPA: SDR family oxidoreductase [Caulobacteraceae bacterium]|nr:SDR family oxidoreductase [Caulobacteraceae bacterium]